MPEGPEVHTITTELNDLISEKIVSDVQATDRLKGLLGDKSVKQFFSEVIGLKITGVERRGKYVIIKLSDNKNLLTHLLMTGQLLFELKYTKKNLPLYTRCTLIFKDGSVLHFADKSTWMKIRILSNKELEEDSRLNELGIDILSSNFTLEALGQVLDANRAIHPLLLDQSILTGLGNIYVNEALFLAKIHPSQKANTLSSKQTKDLYTSTNKIIKGAIKYNGTTFSDYRTPKGNKGSYQNHEIKSRGKKRLLLSQRTEICLR